MKNWLPNTNHDIRIARSLLLQNVRFFLSNKDILEVETPALSRSANTDPFIESISIDTQSKYYLHTSPEYPMKRLLAAGSGDIYQICKVWRADESGSNHNPEFTMLEYYRVGFNYKELMKEVENLLHSVLPELNTPHSFSYAELFLEKFSIDPHASNKDKLLNCVNIEIPSLNTEDLDQQAMLDALLTHCIEPDFDPTRLTFIYDYPASQSALSALREEKNHSVAERFEVYLGSLELGNGYQEETAPQRNREILNKENQTRLALGFKEVPIDEHFLSACDAKIPESAGVAIGLDRVLMAVTGEKSIQKVINFPWDKA